MTGSREKETASPTTASTASFLSCSVPRPGHRHLPPLHLPYVLSYIGQADLDRTVGSWQTAGPDICWIPDGINLIRMARARALTVGPTNAGATDFLYRDLSVSVM